MKLIGIKRMIFLSILIALNAAIAAGYFLWVSPERTTAQNKLKSMKSEISKLQGKIQNTKVELAEYKKNLPAFEELKTKGFVAQPDRFQIPRDLDRVRLAAELDGFSFNINVNDVDYTDAENAKLKVFSSRINVSNVSSQLDTNLYDFVDRMMLEFPMHVRLQRLVIDRKEQLNASALQKIAEGQTAKLLGAEAIFDWLTVLPEDRPDNERPGEPPRGRRR